MFIDFFRKSSRLLDNVKKKVVESDRPNMSI